MNIMDILNVPFGYLMKGLYFISGNNYFIALILFAIVMKVILLPLAIKQQKTQIKGAMLRPKLAAIEKKYAGRTDRVTQQKKQEEIMALQQKEGYSPFSGCLPLLIQLPIIMALYNVIRGPLTYICRLSKESVTAIIAKINEIAGDTVVRANDEISAIHYIREYGEEQFSEWLGGVELPSFTLAGNFLDLSMTPSFTPVTPSGYWLLIIPVLTFVSYYFSMKFTRKITAAAQPTQLTPEAQTSNKIMDFTMPLMSVFFTFSLPAAIGIYWIFQSLIGMLQTFLLAKVMPFPTFTEEDFKAAEREFKVKNKSNKNSKIGTSENAGKVRSLHHIDDDDDEDAVIANLKSSYDDEEDDIPAGEVKSGIESAPLKDDKKH